MEYILGISAALQISLLILRVYEVLDWPVWLLLLPTISQVSAFAIYLAIIWIYGILKPNKNAEKERRKNGRIK